MATMSRRQILYGVTLILISLFCLSWIRVLVVHESYPAKEDQKYIRRVYSTHTVGQTFKTTSALHAIDVLSRVEQPQAISLIVTNEQGKQLSTYTTKLDTHDTWLRIPLKPALAAGEHTLTFRSPEALKPDQAVLLRFQTQSDIYESGYMLVDGQASYGDIAFRSLEKVPLWRAVLIWGQITDKAVVRGLQRISIGILIAVGVWGVEVLMSRTKNKYIVWGLALLVLALATLAIRVPYLTSIEGIFGGDAFNYLTKAQTLVEGGDIFASDPRKGPLYALLLIPGLFTFDPLLWSRLVGMGAAAGAVIFISLVTYHFTQSAGVALSAGVLLAVNQDFIWESPSGLANTLYTCLIVASVWAYLKSKTAQWQWILAMLLGLVFLTRYEGAVIAPILLGGLWWREKFSWKRMLVLCAITLGIMLIPQVSIFWSGSSGIRTVSDLNADDGLSLVKSKNALFYNIGRFYRFIREVWIVPQYGTLIIPGFVLGVLGGLSLLAARKGFPNVHQAVVLMCTIISAVVFLVLLLSKSSAAGEYMVAIPWLCMGLGVVAWFSKNRYNASMITVMLVVQTVVITLILPKQRYYLPLIPFFALLIAMGVYYYVAWPKNKITKIIPLLLINILAAFFFSNGHMAIAQRQEQYNAQAHEVTVMIKAVEYLRVNHGRIGFRVDEEQPIMTFIQKNRRYFFKPTEEQNTARVELEWLRQNKIQYVVERNQEPTWKSVREYPQFFEHRHTFTSIYGDARVLVYAVKLK